MNIFAEITKLYNDFYNKYNIAPNAIMLNDYTIKLLDNTYIYGLKIYKVNSDFIKVCLVGE